MRVIGSHDISTTSASTFLVEVRASVMVMARRLLPVFGVAGGELRALLAPRRFLVDGPRGDRSEPADHRAVGPARVRRELAARGLVHERHELVGEARHRAADADPADVGAAADPVDPAALRDVALDHRSPAAQLDDALGRAVLRSEVALFVVPGPVAALVDRRAEQPRRPQLVVQRDHRSLAGDLVQQVDERLAQVVAVGRAAGDADDREAGLGLPRPPEVVGDTHGAGRVAGHRVDAAVGRAGAYGDDGGRLAGQPVQPLGGLDRLAGHRVGTEPGPVALLLDRLVGDGPLDDEDERLQLSAVRLVPPLDERVRPLFGPALEVDQRPVHLDLREAGQGPEDDLLDARLGGPRERDGVAVTPQATVHPEDVQRGDLRPCRRLRCSRRGGHGPSALLWSLCADRKVRVRPAHPESTCLRRRGAHRPLDFRAYGRDAATLGPPERRKPSESGIPGLGDLSRKPDDWTATWPRQRAIAAVGGGETMAAGRTRRCTTWPFRVETAASFWAVRVISSRSSRPTPREVEGP